MKKLLATALAAMVGLGVAPNAAEAVQKRPRPKPTPPRTIIVHENDDLSIDPFDAKGGDTVILIMSMVGGTYGNHDRCDHMGGVYIEGVAFNMLWSTCFHIDF